MKKVLAIMGSPRKRKHTDNLLDFLLDGVKESGHDIKKIYLRDLDIKPCTGCEYCGRVESCINDDDMTSIYNDFDESDIIIIAAPIYFNSINSLTKNMIDRCQRYWSLKYQIGKDYKNTDDRTGIFLATGGAPFTINQFTGAIPVMDYFFRAINAQYKGNYLISTTDKYPIKERIDIKQELFKIGKDITILKDFYIQR